MYSTLILFLFVAFLLLYNLSKKSGWVNKPMFAIQLGSRQMLSIIISISFMLLAMVMLIFLMGIGAGIFAFVVIQMAAASVIVLLFPFRYLQARHLVLVYLFFALLETFIF